MPNPHVLIVDDDPEIRELVSEVIVADGYRVSQAPDARTAQRQLQDEAVDLMVLDLMLPGKDGLAPCNPCSHLPQASLPVPDGRPTASSPASRSMRLALDPLGNHYRIGREVVVSRTCRTHQAHGDRHLFHAPALASRRFRFIHGARHPQAMERMSRL